MYPHADHCTEHRADRAFDGASVDRLAALLDLNGVSLVRLQVDFNGWWIWRSAMTGHYHAMRKDGHYVERDDRPQRFHVAASTLSRLAVLLLLQTAVDEDDHPLGQRQP